MEETWGTGERGGVYLLDEGGRPYAGWIDQEVGNVPAGDGTSGTGMYDVWDVAFSPNFEDDEQLLAVVSGWDSTDSYYGTWVTPKLGVSGWNTTVDDIELEMDDTDSIVANDKAWICFPDDYDSDPDEGYYTLFVGGAVGGDGSGVYQVLGDGEVAIDLKSFDFPVDVTCLDCAGAADDAYLMI